MTRIIAGTARSRQLKVPAKGTRPTSDRVREAMFNMLDHQVGNWSELRVLDLFAGSGAFALEAVSRGAAFAVAVEHHRPAAEIIRENSKTLGLPIQVSTEDAFHYAKQPQSTAFDLIFIDPPYDVETAKLEQLISDLQAGGAIATGTTVIVERSTRGEPLPTPPGALEATERKYGETRLFAFGW